MNLNHIRFLNSGIIFGAGMKIWFFAQMTVFASSQMFPSLGLAFEITTHQQITEKAIEMIEPALNAYLIDNLNLTGGLYSSVNGLTPKEWMIEGSHFEDESIRPGNHFHDPIRNSGLGGFDSAIDWSLSPIGSQFPEGAYSWNDAREYYFKALTSPTKAERDENWGKTFRALGQIMHLIQDMASPAHVRNDAHLSYFGIGNVDGLHDYMERQSVASYLGGGMIGPDRPILEQAGATRPEPFSNLFDANQYSGTNPDATLGGHAGLSEYANANFFSDDTIPFQPFFNFPSYNHPNLSEVIPAISPFPAGQSYVTLLRLGSPSDPHARIAKYTGNQALAKFTLAHLQYDLIGQLQLDDAVYDAYSSHLIPRAVGYSAAVLKYFFRGTSPIGFTQYCFQPGFQSTPPNYAISIDVEISLPDQFQDGGSFYSYVDRPDGQRENMSGFVWESSRLGIPFGMGGGIVGDDLGHPGPLRVTIVYEGKLGPIGAAESNGVVGTTHMITKFIEPCLQ